MTYKEKIINATNMIFVEGGTFLMGDENENKKVTLDSYYISETAVTIYLWGEIIGFKSDFFEKNIDIKKPVSNINWGEIQDYIYKLKNVDIKRPITNINWFEVQEFLYKLNDLTGKNYSLPTEAQWEFAARGGNKSQGYIYSGSNDVNEVAWTFKNTRNDTQFWNVPPSVGQKKPNELGLYDMSGNVYEWCKDFYAPYTEDDKINPCCEIGENDPEFGIRKIMRGGSFLFGENDCRVTHRSYAKPDIYTFDTGFRLVENI
jgi:formylglycine-generating enzyme required for sulfatase activity